MPQITRLKLLNLTINNALKIYSSIETDLLLSHILGQPQEFLFLHPEKELSITQEKRLHRLVERRLRGEPMAYVLGYKYSYGLKFLVDKNVLIPRPETEWLVDRAVSIAKTHLKGKGAIKIIDVGTGSGCIAVSLAKTLNKDRENLNRIKITATDISAKALAVAKHNAKLHKVRVKFVKSDLLKSVSGQFDLIIANLPYVPRSDYRKLKDNLKYEPRLTLVDESGKFDLYRQLFNQIKTRADKGARVLLEIDPTAKPYLSAYLIKAGLNQIKFFKDYQGLWRFAEAALSRSKFQ
jgi:release factor glutamine methyltransferase